MNDLEIKLGEWVFKLEARGVYYTFKSAFYGGTEVNCRRIEIRMEPGEFVEVTTIDAKAKADTSLVDAGPGKVG